MAARTSDAARGPPRVCACGWSLRRPERSQNGCASLCFVCDDLTPNARPASAVARRATRVGRPVVRCAEANNRGAEFNGVGGKLNAGAGELDGSRDEIHGEKEKGQ